MSGRSESAVSRETPKQHTSAGADQIVNDDDNFTAPYAAISSGGDPHRGGRASSEPSASSSFGDAAEAGVPPRDHHREPEGWRRQDDDHGEPCVGARPSRGSLSLWSIWTLRATPAPLWASSIPRAPRRATSCS